MVKKNNKGSALAIVFVLLIFMSYFGIMIMSAAYENIQISRSYMGDRKMYRGTDYVANLISIRLQKAIRDIQDTTKSQIATSIQLKSHLKSQYEEYLTEEGALNSQDYDYAFNKEYKTKFKNNFEASPYGASIYSSDTKNLLIKNGSKSPSPSVPEPYYEVAFTEGEKMYYKLNSAGYDSTTGCVTCEVETKFEYNNEIRDDFYFQNRNLSTLVFKVGNETEDFNIENYKIVNNRNDVIPIFSKNVALLAQKNIIFSNDADSDINITGDVISFGYVPQSSGVEDENATWNRYGGIFFGYSKKLNSYRTEIFGSSWTSSLGSIFGSVNKLAGNVTIDGNVATMGYVNVAYNQSRNVRITGDTFARQFLLSEDSHQSRVYLGYDDDIRNKYLERGNLYVTDDLQIDSSYAKLIVYGDFYGLADMYTSKGGSDANSDWLREKRTSTLNINGNSTVELRNKVYIGGTSFISDLKRNDGTNNGTYYMTGVSGSKTSQIITEAYIYSDKNKQVYDSSGALPESQTRKANYKWKDDITISMMTGYGTNVDSAFLQSDRAIHFKKYFGEKIANNFGLLGTSNFGNLRVKTNADGKMLGWAQGVIIAAGVKDFSNILGNEKVEAYYGNSNFSENETEIFHSATDRYSQYAIMQRYQTYMDAFLNYENFGTSGRKLIQATVDTNKGLTEYINNVNSDSVLNFIKNHPGTEYKNDKLGAMVYYNTGTCKLTMPGVRIKIENGSETKYLSYSRGIIFVDGDIEIGDHVTFEGVIVATGNISVTGKNVNITRYSDISDLSKDIVNKLKEDDYSVRMFFGLNEYDIDENNAVVQRINQDYVKLIKWTLD